MADSPDAASRRSPAALEVADLVRLLRAAGARHADEDAVRRDLDAGAPVNADGTLHLVRYAAWLVRTDARPEGARGD
ncbi:MAG: hypothetical protein JNM94_12220 [Phycisphaerae bacterium]|nr:hypothetical protein [Phycisphaerae bacterium]